MIIFHNDPPLCYRIHVKILNVLQLPQWPHSIHLRTIAETWLQPSKHHLTISTWESEKKECGPFCLRLLVPAARILTASKSFKFRFGCFHSWVIAMRVMETCHSMFRLFESDHDWFFFWRRKLIVGVFLQDDEPPEITYCVVENTGTLTLQALTPTQPMPPQDELDAKFAELVVRMNKIGNLESIGCSQFSKRILCYEWLIL